MLTKILKKYLLPYKKSVAFILLLLLIQAIANLYLPNLNADLINNGVAKVDWSSTFGRPAYTLKDEKGNELVSYDSNIRSGYKKVPSSLKSSHFQNP